MRLYFVYNSDGMVVCNVKGYKTFRAALNAGIKARNSLSLTGTWKVM